MQYTEYALAVDEIAERIRAVGARAPGSYTEFAKLASVKEDPPAMERIRNLAAEQEATVGYDVAKVKRVPQRWPSSPRPVK